jgi:hypothetical protein
LAIIYTIVFSAPISPVVTKEPIEEQQFWRSIEERWNTLDVVTANPDGSRRGKYGEMVLLNNSGTYYIEICVSSPSGTVWRGAQLSDTP